MRSRSAGYGPNFFLRVYHSESKSINSQKRLRLIKDLLYGFQGIFCGKRWVVPNVDINTARCFSAGFDSSSPLTEEAIFLSHVLSLVL